MKSYWLEGENFDVSPKYDVKHPVLTHSLTPLLLFPLPLTLPAPGTCCLPASSIGIVSVSVSPVEQCLDTKPSALYTLHNVSTIVLHTDTRTCVKMVLLFGR